MVFSSLGNHFAGKFERFLAVSNLRHWRRGEEQGEIVFDVCRIGLSYKNVFVNSDCLSGMTCGLMGEGERELVVRPLRIQCEGFLERFHGLVVLFDLQVCFAKCARDPCVLFSNFGDIFQDLPGFLLVSCLPERDSERDFEGDVFRREVERTLVGFSSGFPVPKPLLQSAYKIPRLGATREVGPGIASEGCFGDFFRFTPG